MYTTSSDGLASVKIRISGVSPILHHSSRLSDPLNPIVRESKKISGKRKKTDADYLEMSRLEWLGGLYVDDREQPLLPSESIKAAIIGGAKKEKAGPQAKGGTFVFDSPPLSHDEAGKSLEELWNDGEGPNVHKASVKVMSARVIRTRPQFNGWSAEAVIHYDPTIAEAGDVVRWLETAGRIIGLGDWRPEKSGNFGRFTVDVIESSQGLDRPGSASPGTA